MPPQTPRHHTADPEPTLFAGAFIGLALSTLASTAAFAGASLALGTAAIRPCRHQNGHAINGNGHATNGAARVGQAASGAILARS